jgi:hypothetical protein
MTKPVAPHIAMPYDMVFGMVTAAQDGQLGHVRSTALEGFNGFFCFVMGVVNRNGGVFLCRLCHASSLFKGCRGDAPISLDAPLPSRYASTAYCKWFVG